MSGAVAMAHRSPAPTAKARKGTYGRKNEIGRGYHHGEPDVEERAIERAVRQEARPGDRGGEQRRDAEIEELGRAMAETHRDPVLQALHVGCGALAIEATQGELDAIAEIIGAGPRTPRDIAERLGER